MPAVCNNRGDLIVADRKEDGTSGAGVMYNTRTGMMTCHVHDTWWLLIALDPSAITDHPGIMGPVQTSKGHIMSGLFGGTSTKLVEATSNFKPRET